MTSGCGKARRILWPDGSPRVVTTEWLEAERHVEACAYCRRFLEEMVQAAERLRTEIVRPAAPLEVRDRLFKAVAHARIGYQRRSWRSRGLIAALAALTVAVVGTWWVVRSRGEPGQPIAELLVADHQRAVGADGLRSADPAVTTRWLERQLDFAVQVPTFPNAELLGARVVVLDGRRAAAMQYRIDGRLVSYYVSPVLHVPGSAGMRPPSPARWAGYQVVSWQEPGLLHALVGTLSDARLEELARICIAQMGMTLSADDASAVGSAPI
ncbi:MAG: hypothetical protein ABI836_15365 [Gemmatimonadota bacterium]